MSSSTGADKYRSRPRSYTAHMAVNFDLAVNIEAFGSVFDD
jgi:hypothetical protein